MEIKIKINEIEMTIEEAKDLHKQLNDLFGSKLANRSPSFNYTDYGNFINPKDLTTMIKT